MRIQSHERGGSTLVEFTLVGIPLMFVLISVFEIGRGMWSYHTLAAAVKAGTRFAVVHGEDCAQSPNTCTVTIGQIATRIQQAGPGLMPDQLNLTFTSADGVAVPCSLTVCLGKTTTWPPSTANAVGMKVAISGTYPFRSMISMFWPGAGGGVGPFAVVNFPAASKESIQF